MSPKTILTSAAVLAGIFVGIAVYAKRACTQSQAMTSALSVRAQRLKEEADQLKNSIAATASQMRATTAAALAKSSQPVRGDARGKQSALPNINDRLLHNPKLQALSVAVQRARCAQNYDLLFQRLKLSPDQIAKFEDIVGERASKQTDIHTTALAEGLPPSDPAIRALNQQANEQFQAAEEALLGASGFQQAQAYDRTLNVRSMVDGLAGNVAFTDPITAAQAERLTQALANASPSYQQGGPADVGNIDYDRVDQEAQRILSTSQFAAWQQQASGKIPSRWMNQFTGILFKSEAPSKASNGP